MIPPDAALLPALLTAAAIVCLAVYVIVDGFDLGVGMLLPLAGREEDRDVMTASVAPAWDGNEAWLVMGGLLLVAAHPAGGFMLSPAFCLPAGVMLAALILRWIVVMLRGWIAGSSWIWDCAFAGGSLLATLCQGLVLGLVIAGPDGSPAGGALESLGLPGLLFGIGLIGLYALLGAGWLIWRTEGPAQVFGREIAHAALILTGAAIVAFVVWGVIDLPRIGVLAPLAALACVLLALTWRRIWTGRRSDVFTLAVLVVLLGLAAFVICLRPDLVASQATLRNGFAAPQGHMLVSVAVAILVAVVLLCQAHACRVLLGKVGRPAGGHRTYDP